MHSSDKLYFALNLLIDISEEKQKELVNFCNHSSKAFARELATIKCCSSRGSGHSKAIIKLVNDRFTSPLIITPNVHSAQRNFYELCKDTNVFFSTPASLKNIYGIPHRDAIIVDCASLISSSKINEIYDSCLPLVVCSKPYFFILIE